MNPSREIVPLVAADISSFCKTLRQQLTTADVAPVPSHLVLLNMLARSAGHRNYQALRAAPLTAPVALETEVTVQKTIAFAAIAIPRDESLSRAVKRAVTHFDTAGRLMRWPTQFAVQQQALWALWVRLPAKRDMNEAEVNRYLSRYNTFGDFAILRRELVNAKFLWRTIDGRTYRKEARQADIESAAFLKTLLTATTESAPEYVDPKAQRRHAR